MIVFDPLWDTLKRKGISTYTLQKDYRVSKGLIDRLKNNRNVNTFTLNNLCKIIDCSLSDIAKYIPDTPEDE